MADNNIKDKTSVTDVPETGEEIESPARRLKDKRAKNTSREILSWVMSIGIAVCAAFLIRAFIFEIILVDGESMFPTLHNNERVAIEKMSRYATLPERGDIIIVKYPDMDGTYVKRVIGLPGDILTVIDSTVFVNGMPLDEPYINPEPYMDMEPQVVPEDAVFVMGDNRAHSMDSRVPYVGPIDKSNIVGHAMFVIWPLNNIHSVS